MKNFKSRHLLIDSQKDKNKNTEYQPSMNETTLDAEIGAWEMGGRYFE